MSGHGAKTLEHRGFSGSVEVSIDDNVLFGRVLFIEDLVVYEGNTLDEVRSAFQAAVDEYIADFESEGKAVPAPFKGTFNVRVGPELHRKAAVLANRREISLNELVKEALANAVSGGSREERESAHVMAPTYSVGDVLWHGPAIGPAVLTAKVTSVQSGDDSPIKVIATSPLHPDRDVATNVEGARRSTERRRAH